MSVSLETSEATMTSTAVPFSYAQAARGKTTTPTSSSDTKLDTSSWPGDVAEAVVSPVEHGNGTGTISPQSRIADEVSSSPKLVKSIDRHETIKEVTTDFVPSSSALGNQDYSVSDSKPSSEATWESKSQTSNTATTPQSASEEPVQSSEKSKHDSQGDLQEPSLDDGADVFERPFKDAPIPTINFWQQRAQEAKEKQNKAQSASKSTILATNSQSTNSTLMNGPQADSAKVQRKLQQSANADNAKEIRVTGDNKESNVVALHGSRASRPYKSEGEIPNVTSPPPVGDAVFWPTPLNAQDDEKRKVLEKGDKLEKERATATVSKPHGKNEWKAVPYTPSVKFNTPLPQRGGRGGRGGARGGRGGATVERSSTFPHGQSSMDMSRSARQNEKAGASGARTSSLPENSAQLKDASQESDDLTNKVASQPSSEDSEPTMIAESTPSLKDDSTLAESQTPTQQTVTQLGQERSTHRETTSWTPADSIEVRDIKPKVESNGTQSFSNRKKNSTSFGDSSFEIGAGPRPKRRSSQVANRNEVSTLENKERRRTAFEGESLTEKLELPSEKSELHSQPQLHETPREAWVSIPHRERGEGRPERGRAFKSGRGGHGQGVHYNLNPHHQNAHLPPIQTSNPTKGNQSSHSHHFSQSASFAPNSRNFRSGPRSASIPNESTYGRFAPAYPNGYQYAYPPFQNGMYEYTGIGPMSITPYSPYVEHSMLISEISTQLTYYFSLENMLKDLFLRKHMDSQGFVALSLLANFKRMRDLTHDTELIKFVCLQHGDFDLVVGADGKDRLRKRDDWEQWVLSMDERDPSAQIDGNIQHEPSSTAYEMVLGQSVPHSAIGLSFPAHGIENHSQPFSAAAASFTPMPIGSPINGYHGSSPVHPVGEHKEQKNGTETVDSTGLESQSKSPARPVEESDIHHDDQTRFLRIATRPLTRNAHGGGATSESWRVASSGLTNGSDDREPQSGTMEHNSGLNSRLEGDSTGESSRYTSEGGRSLPARSSPAMSPSPDSAQCIWIKENEMEKFLPLPQNADYMSYEELHARALEQRRHAAHGHTPYDLFVLYNFWSHFLIRNFNSNMYEEFHRLAHDDSTANSSEAGMESLIRYYQEALTGQSPIRDQVARDYVSIAAHSRVSKNRSGFESLRSAWRNGATNMKNRKKVSDFVEVNLRAELDR